MVLDREAARDGGRGGVGARLGRVEARLLSPDQPAPLDDLLKETAEDGEAEALANTSEVGTVGQGLVQAAAEVLQQREALVDYAHEPGVLEERHDELQLEEDHRVHRLLVAPA